MASIKNGILGGFTGKIGNVVGYSTYGVDRMRSISDRTAPATAAELRNRKQFKLVQDTLNCIKELIKIGFNNYWTKTGGTRGAISYNKTKAVQLNDDDCAIDPERFRFSGGVLPGLNNAAFEMERDDLLRFNWNPELAYGASPKDQVMLLAIDLEGKKASYECLGNFRSSGTDVLRLSNDLKGKNLDIYIAVVAKDRSEQSDSQYLGRIIAPDGEHDQVLQEEANIPQQIVKTSTFEPHDILPIILSDEVFQQTLVHQPIEIPAIAKQESNSQHLGRISIRNPDHDLCLHKETDEPRQIVKTTLSESQKDSANLIYEGKNIMPNALNKEELQQTLINQTIEVPAVAKQETGIQPYIRILSLFNLNLIQTERNLEKTNQCYYPAKKFKLLPNAHLFPILLETAKKSGRDNTL